MPVDRVSGRKRRLSETDMNSNSSSASAGLSKLQVQPRSDVQDNATSDDEEYAVETPLSLDPTDEVIVLRSQLQLALKRIEELEQTVEELQSRKQ